MKMNTTIPTTTEIEVDVNNNDFINHSSSSNKSKKK